jgi:hypothetical protein
VCWSVLERATAGMQALDAKVKSVVINDIDHEAVFGALKAKVPGVLWLQLERLQSMILNTKPCSVL